VRWRDELRCNHLIVALFLGTFFLGSCGIFDTRDPDPPGSDNQVLPVATTPELLISNFQTAIQQKNVQEYEKLFADTTTHAREFQFIPNQSAEARYGRIIFSNWNKPAEVEWFRNVMSQVNANSVPQLFFTDQPQLVQYQADSALYTANYLLFVDHTKKSLTTKFVGRSEFYLAPDKNRVKWMIYRWVDFETGIDSSWSELKGQFAK
jgi:hypothetical protein